MLLYLGVTETQRLTGNDSVLFCGLQNNHSESALQILLELAGFVPLLQTQMSRLGICLNKKSCSQDVFSIASYTR